MSSKKVAEIVVETLEAAGIRHCYGIVGDTLNHVTDAIHRSQIQWVHVRHEEAAAFAAGAESYISGRLTACAGSCGPGSLHFINGVYEAQRNRAPMVLIASQIVTPQLGMEFSQEVDFKAVYASCSVFCEQVHSPEQARRVVALACQAALNRRGVAVVILPADISQATVKDDLPFSVHFPQPVLRPSDAELQDVARLLAHGKKIGIYAGSGCQGAHDLLVALADRLKAPIAHVAGQGLRQVRQPLQHGHDRYARDRVRLPHDDRVRHPPAARRRLRLGAVLSAEGHPDPGRPRRQPPGPPPPHRSRRGRRRDPHPRGAPAAARSPRGAQLPRRVPGAPRALAANAGKEEQAGKGELIHPQHLVSLLDQHASEDALFTADGGSAMVWLLRHIHSNGKRRTLTSLVHGTMANAMPQALGLKKAYPERQVISISGDGGLAMLLGDLLTAIQEKLPIKVVVLNNASLNFVELEQKVEGLLDNYTDLLSGLRPSRRGDRLPRA